MTASPTPAARPLPGVAIALAAGVCGGIQPKINADLGEHVDSSVLAALVNFTGAFVVVLVMLSLRARTRRNLLRLPSWPVPRVTLAAGVGGALVVLSGAAAVETIGVAIFSVAFFAGQIASGLGVDRLGIAPGGVRPIVPTRVQAAVLGIVAVVVSQFGQPLGEFAPALLLLVVMAGAASAFQSAFNARITGSIGDPFAATSVNVTVGLTALALIVAILTAAGQIDAPDWPSEPWLYTGGFLGAVIVFGLAVSSAALGVLRATLAMLAAQLVTAFLVDWVVEDAAPTAGSLAGAALITAAVVLVSRDRPLHRPAA